MRGRTRSRQRVNKQTGEFEEVVSYFLFRGGITGWQEVSKEEYEAEFPDKPIGEFGKESTWKRPIISTGAGVVLKRLKQTKKLCSDYGVPTEFSGDGRPLFVSRSHRKKYLRLMNLHDNQGGYGD